MVTPMFALPIVLFLLLVVAGLIGLAVWAVVRSKNAGSNIPKCGKCGYAVRGIGSLHCPECGVDLREAGIVKPDNSNSTVWIVIIAGIVGAMMVCVCSGILIFTARNSVAVPVKTIRRTAPATQKTTAKPISPAPKAGSSQPEAVTSPDSTVPPDDAPK